MKIYVDLRCSPDKSIIVALESGCDGVILQEGRTVPGLMEVLTDESYKKNFEELEITPSSQEYVLRKISNGKNIVITPSHLDAIDVLSLENLVASNNAFYVSAKDSREVEVAKAIMQRGVKGVILKPNSDEEIRKSVKAARKTSEKIEISKAKVLDIANGGCGDRVFVDSIHMMGHGQGMLVGNTTAGYFLVNSESVENSYTGKRPFRVNAGAVHGSILQPDNKTEYLSELKIGDPLLIADHAGECLESRVGRIKIESRPFVLVRAKHEEKDISVYLQNGSQIHLVSPNGSPIPITSLKKGDYVLANVRNIEGRHMGIKYDERIIEK